MKKILSMFLIYLVIGIGVNMYLLKDVGVCNHTPMPNTGFNPLDALLDSIGWVGDTIGSAFFCQYSKPGIVQGTLLWPIELINYLKATGG